MEGIWTTSNYVTISLSGKIIIFSLWAFPPETLCKNLRLQMQNNGRSTKLSLGDIPGWKEEQFEMIKIDSSLTPILKKTVCDLTEVLFGGNDSETQLEKLNLRSFLPKWELDSWSCMFWEFNESIDRSGSDRWRREQRKGFFVLSAHGGRREPVWSKADMVREGVYGVCNITEELLDILPIRLIVNCQVELMKGAKTGLLIICSCTIAFEEAEKIVLALLNRT